MTLDQYIGIPFIEKGRAFDACDCWGLVCLWYFYEYGIKLPLLLSYSSTGDAGHISGIISRQKRSWVRVDDPKPGDVVVIRIAGKETHVGIYLQGRKMLHSMQGTQSCIESLKSPKWKNRIAGVYRYA